MRIAILSNVNLDLLNKALSKENEVFQQEGYGQWIQNIINPEEAFLKFDPEAVFVLLDGNALLEGVDNVDEAEQELSTALGYCEAFAAKFPSLKVFISNIDISPKKIIEGDKLRPEHRLMNYWESSLERILQNNLNIHLFDLRKLIEDFGRLNFYSDKMWYMGSIPYSIKAFSFLADAINSKLRCHSSVRKKVLVLDLDNTLWGGVLGEDGFDGIQLSRSLLGAAYRDAQLRIKELVDSGVLLAIISKNNEEDVMHVLSEHPQMVLRPEDFVSIIANWDSKAENIVKLAERLNLGLDSFVFLDDNPVEREAVRTALPHVSVVDFPKDVSQLPKTIQRMADEYFFSARLTKEDLSKNEQYRQEAARRIALNNAVSMEAYLKSLQIKVLLEEMKASQIERVAQLTQKTNQFNLLTRRYSVEQLIAYCSNPENHIYVASVSDKYGDSGLVLVLMISEKGDTAEIDNLLMSCRAMGRHIEDVVITAVEEKLKEKGVKKVVAEYIPTARNKPVENLLDRLDYQLISVTEDNKKSYCRLLEEEYRQRKILFDVTWG